MNRRITVLISVCVGLVWSLPALSQSRLAASLELDVSTFSLKSETAALSESLSGVLVGGAATLSWSAVSLGTQYLQGTADPDGSGEGRDVVEGSLMLGFQVVPWLALRIGPHARSYITDVGTQRWLYWELRVAAQTRLGSPVLLAYFEGWNGISSKLDVVESLDRAQGLEGGFRLEPRRTPVWARIGYRMDHSRLGGGLRRETAEYLIVGLGLAFGAR
jgi:hypothetical protein